MFVLPWQSLGSRDNDRSEDEDVSAVGCIGASTALTRGCRQWQVQSANDAASDEDVPTFARGQTGREQ